MGARMRGVVRGKQDKRSAGGTSSPAPKTASGGDGTREARRRRSSAGRFEDWIWSRLLIPDPQIVWTAAAYASGLYIARREKPDVLYSSSPPNSLNVLALALARKLGLPWIADFRDPWTDGLRRRQWYPDNPARQ